MRNRVDISRFNISSDELEKLIDTWIIGRNAKRDREILKLKLIDGLTFERLAETVELSDRRVKDIVYKSLDILIKHINIH